ncbi:hypothetical protein DM01DRAFT_1321815 [Hesseltinella vesiculosa]|uniref:CNH domain-containing protein n=1 Tax=Hesseltinella vesiculosa TaxID=101127 RepID=A0A1X2GI96_9FUNG|nr:hypothetical protein DM01DRAFT_1321815 [Hesseltinella vesiculosa]
MPYIPYTLQTLISRHDIDKVVNAASPDASNSRFSLRSSGSPTNSFLPSSPTNLNARFNQIISSSGQRVRIDAVDAWGNHIYLGTSNGHILHFILEDKQHQASGQMPSNAKLENKIELNHKPIERILVIPQVSKAVVLQDSTLFFFSLPFFTPISHQTIAPIKGVSCFTHDIAQDGKIGQDGTVELCIVKRRSMQLYKLGEFLQYKKDIPLQDSAISITRYGKLFCLADVHEYKLISDEPVAIMPLIPTPREPASPASPSQSLLGNSLVPRPVAAVVKPGEFLLVSGSANDQTIGLFVDARGSAIHGTMQWSSYPKSICVEYPYIAALLRNHTIEIHSFTNLQLLQTIDLPDDFEPRGMFFSHGLKVYLDHLAKRLTKRAWVPSAAGPHPPADQLEDDLQLHLKREAIRFSTVPARILVYGAHTVMAQLVMPLLLQINDLIDSHRIEEAMEMTDQARDSMSSTKSIHVERMRTELDYIYQKCGMLLLKETVFEDAFALFSKGDMDPRLAIYFFGDQLGGGVIDPSDPLFLFDDVCALVEQVGFIDDIVNNNVHGADASGTENMRQALLKNAREAAQKYLLTERGKRRDVLGHGQPVGKVIDTALLKLYVMTGNDLLLTRLLKEPNDCDLDACTVTLHEAKKYYFLHLFLESKKQHQGALELWTKMYDGQLKDPAFNEDLDRLKQRLLRSSDLTMPLVLDYTWWLMRHGKLDAVDILIESPFANDMDPNSILTNLEEYDLLATKTYLEYLVLTKKSTEASYHTRLASTYVHELQAEIQQPRSRKELTQTVKKFKTCVRPMEPNRPSPTFVSFLCEKTPSTPLLQIRLRLLRLLQQSSSYEASSLLTLLDQTGPLQIEKAIVYGKLGMHQEALNTLIHELGDFVGAEIFCATNGQSTGSIDFDE